MRRVLLVTLLALTSACSSATSPSDPPLSGVWSENFSFPGASLVITLDSAGNGSGTYAIEAGRSGVVQVRGTDTAAAVTLVIQYDYGPSRTFTGNLSDSTHLTGVFSDAPGTVTFTRQQ